MDLSFPVLCLCMLSSYPDFRNRHKPLSRFWETPFWHFENSDRKQVTVAWSRLTPVLKAADYLCCHGLSLVIYCICKEKKHGSIKRILHLEFSHQSRLQIFTHCSLVLWSSSDTVLTAVKGEDIFNICSRSLLLLLEIRWISPVCNAV